MTTNIVGKITQVMGAVVTKRILRFLAEDYWGRFLGWPDFLVHRDADWFLAEVKSSKDRLSGAQKEWFEANGKYLGLPAKVIKVHRAKTVRTGLVSCGCPKLGRGRLPAATQADAESSFPEAPAEATK